VGAGESPDLTAIVLGDVTLPLVVLTALAGSVAGLLGALFGIGGGVFLVPALVQGLHVSMPHAVAISLTTVIATSNAVSAHPSGRPYINVRLGLVVELATVIGGLTGGLVAPRVAPTTLALLFSAVMGALCVSTFARRARRNVLPAEADPGRWGGRFDDEQSGTLVSYRVVRLPLAVAASFVAGTLATLLGIGGGVVKVPVLNGWCGVPIRAAAATNAFTLGVTATAGAMMYLGRGWLIPALAAAAVLGVQAGSGLGLRLAESVPANALKLALAIVLGFVAIVMAVR
jgi:uncharacterized membrane protein YfcA